MRVDTCRGCKKRILMAYHNRTGRLGPIDIEPSEDGNISITGDRYEVVPAEEREAYRRQGFPLRKNHFATCVDAKSFAKKPLPANVVKFPRRKRA